MRRGTLSPEACFAEKIRFVHEYRKFLSVDPGLPAVLLPPRWPDQEAAVLFRGFYAAVDRPPARFLEEVLETPPTVAIPAKAGAAPVASARGRYPYPL